MVCCLQPLSPVCLQRCFVTASGSTVLFLLCLGLSWCGTRAHTSDVTDTWTREQGHNCYSGHGAFQIDTDPISYVTIQGCIAHCEQMLDCDGITFQTDGSGNCWRRKEINVAQCDTTSAEFDTYVRATWTKAQGLNCFAGHGATEIDAGSIGSLTVEDCQAKCVEMSDCTGVTHFTNGNVQPGECWRRKDIVLNQCENSGNAFDTYVRSLPLTPPPTPAPACIKPGGTSWMACIKSGYYYLPPGTYYLDRHFQLPDNVYIEGAGTDQTIIEATQGVHNGCGSHAENPGDPSTRIGFVLGNDNYIGKFKFVAKDTHRWQGYNGAPLCGGAVFETPGCSDAYCKSENIGDAKYGDGGVSNIVIDDVLIRGSDESTGPQLAVFITQTKDLTRPTHGIHIRGVDMDHSWCDGINLHGAVRDAIVENCNLAFQGDDNLAVWSAGELATNITFRHNTVSQKQSTNPTKTWGNCVALYGGGEINVLDTVCHSTSDGGVKFAETFGGLWGHSSNVLVQKMVVDNGKPACIGETSASLPKTVDNCPKQSGSQCLPVLDSCFVHKNCKSGIGYTSDPKSSMGAGWYCSDGEFVTPDMQFDRCCIHPGCPTAIFTGSFWTCKDKWPDESQLLQFV